MPTTFDLTCATCGEELEWKKSGSKVIVEPCHECVGKTRDDHDNEDEDEEEYEEEYDDYEDHDDLDD